MKIAREIKIQKLQTKNRMVGQTFNPSGHTAQSLADREAKLVEEYRNMSEEDRTKTQQGFEEVTRWKKDNNLHYSNTFEHNVFMRAFG